MKRPLLELKPHPLNAQLYQPFQGKEFDDFKKSLQDHGLIHELKVKPDGTILSGHRRWQAALELGWTEIEVEVVEPADDRLYIVESNRYRQKKLSELYAEAQLIESVIAEYNRNKLVTGERGEGWEGQTRERVATIVGIGSGRQYDKIKTIIQAAEANPNIADKLDKIDRGETSVDAVYKLVTGKLIETQDFEPKVYNVWNFGEVDPRFGMPYPGRIPGQVVQNIVYYFSEEEELVVDPMAGGGTTVDVCQVMNRRCLALDIDPSRPDITQWDMRDGYPAEAQNCDLIFIDPPYWNMIKEDYVLEAASQMTMEEFCNFMRLTIQRSAGALRVGGHLALLIMTQLDRLPEGYSYIDWPFFLYEEMRAAGLHMAQRIGVNWPTSIYQAFHVNMAKEKKRMLGILGDIVVGRRTR